jgi:REP element-mobilizing transposase RayT
MYELALDICNTGPTWLNNPTVAKVVKEAMHYRDANEYDLFAYCLMSNHVHIVFEHLDKNSIEASTKEYTVTKILQEMKRYTAQKCNKVLGRNGAFWQSESYDRVIRDAEELENTVAYTLNNPVKAGLVKHWKDWPYTYCKPEFLKSFG